MQLFYVSEVSFLGISNAIFHVKEMYKSNNLYAKCLWIGKSFWIKFLSSDWMISNDKNGKNSKSQNSKYFELVNNFSEILLKIVHLWLVFKWFSCFFLTLVNWNLNFLTDWSSKSMSLNCRLTQNLYVSHKN